MKKVTVTNSANGQDYVREYSYDAIGNILYKSDVGDYLYEGHLGTSFANPHAATSAGGKTYTYDKNGNLISNGTWTHAWDYNNRLVSSTNGEKTISYGYDVSGNRVNKTDGVKTTYYFSQYYETEGGKVKKHIYNGGSKVASIEDGNIVYHHTDHLSGSNTETNSDGNMVEVVDYYPFGSTRVNESYAGYENDYKFTGKEKDEDTGLYYYGARYYDSSIGRFMSEDPLVVYLNLGFLLNPQKLNGYSYVLNNPLKYIDPFGLDSTVFYDPDAYARQASDEQASLQERYGTTAHLVPVKTEQEFIDAWNSMGSDGNPIDGVSLLFHGGDPQAISIDAGNDEYLTSNANGLTPLERSATYIGSLSKKDIDAINIYTCHGGDISGHSNVASSFATTQQTTVNAFDGNVSFYGTYSSAGRFGLNRYNPRPSAIGNQDYATYNRYPYGKVQYSSNGSYNLNGSGGWHSIYRALNIYNMIKPLYNLINL